jgi:integrase
VGSIDRRSDGKWRARWREYPGGPQKAKHFRRKLDAERFLTAVEHSKLAGTYVDPAAGRVRFRMYAEEWRQLQVHRAGTATSVEQHLRCHVYPRIGNRPIGAIRSSEIQALVTRLGQELSPTTVEVVYGRVAAVFRSAVRDQVIVRSPCVEIKLPRKTPASPDELLTADQVLAQSDAMPIHYRALVVVGAATGLRPGELFGLALDRIDFLRRHVRVDQQLVRVRGQGVALAPLKTAASYRTVPLPGTGGEALAVHLQARPVSNELGLVFTNERSGPIQQSPFATVWEGARSRAGLPCWATPHDLRHFYASTLIRAGLSVKVVQTRLGHASARTTLDVYGHLFPDEEDRTRQAVDDLFRATGGTAEGSTEVDPPAAGSAERADRTSHGGPAG